MNQQIKPVKKILVVYKRTFLEQYLKRYARQSKIVMTPEVKKLFRVAHQSHEQHLKALQIVENEIKKHKIPYQLKSRQKFGFKNNFDLVITVGGDGTLLRTAHGVKKEPILGVNSVPATSVGALCSVTVDQFASKLDSILKGSYKVHFLNRLKIRINRKVVPFLALNDILISNPSPAGTSRYAIKIENYFEDQKSSGIWVSTAAGSTAAIFAAGGVVMPRESKKIQYLIREPYRDQKKSLQLIRGVLSEKSTIEVLIKMLDASLFIDGSHGFHPLAFGDRVVISNANLPLKVIV